MDFDPRDSDPRDRDDESMYGSRWGEEVRERDGVDRELDPRDHDPRDPFVHSVDLPRGLERELVQDARERLYELNGDDSQVKPTRARRHFRRRRLRTCTCSSCPTISASLFARVQPLSWRSRRRASATEAQASE